MKYLQFLFIAAIMISLAQAAEAAHAGEKKWDVWGEWLKVFLFHVFKVIFVIWPGYMLDKWLDYTWEYVVGEDYLGTLPEDIYAKAGGGHAEEGHGDGH